MQMYLHRRHGARGLVFAVIAAIGLAGVTPAFADWDHDRGRWHHDHWDHDHWDHDHWHHHGYWRGGVWVQPDYAAPPVVYAPPPPYAPPPVVYSPGISFGVNIGR